MFERLWKMSSKQILGFSVLIIIVLTGITLLVNTAIVNFISDCQLTRLGQVGDSFGSLNALLNFATIAILIYTISQQRREKKESDARYLEQKEQAESHFHDRKKLDADHHAELKDQAQRIHDAEKEQIQKNFDEEKKYLKNQELTDEHKRFESTFFSLMNLHSNVIERIGKPVFAAMLTRLNGLNSGHLATLKEDYLRDIELDLRSHLYEYFSTIELIFDFLKKAEKSEPYISIYLAQFSSRERLILMYCYKLSDNRPAFLDNVNTRLFTKEILDLLPDVHRSHMNI